MKIIFFSFLLIFLATSAIACMPCHASSPRENSIVIAKQYVGIVETPKDSNRGPFIDKLHDYYGISYGNSYCLMFAIWCNRQAYVQVNQKSTINKFARCSTFYKWAENNPLSVKLISTKKAVWGAGDVQSGDIIIWKHGMGSDAGNWNGHAGLVQKYTKPDQVRTVEGNTSPGPEGSQTNGGGFYERNRKFDILSSFPIKGFIRSN